ncbi:hypothetical protein LINPERHAP1_LOCUS7765 [Linum perenne]
MVLNGFLRPWNHIPLFLSVSLVGHSGNHKMREFLLAILYLPLAWLLPLKLGLGLFREIRIGTITWEVLEFEP